MVCGCKKIHILYYDSPDSWWSGPWCHLLSPFIPVPHLQLVSLLFLTLGLWNSLLRGFSFLFFWRSLFNRVIFREPSLTILSTWPNLSHLVSLSPCFNSFLMLTIIWPSFMHLFTCLLFISSTLLCFTCCYIQCLAQQGPAHSRCTIIYAE